MSELAQKTVHELKALLATKQASSQEIVSSLLTRIKTYDEKIGGYLTVCDTSARSSARRMDELRSQGKDLGPLMGIPLSPKDIFLTKGITTTCASQILAGYVPPYHASVITDCLDAGAFILGKLNMDEFAMGSSNETSSYKPCRNPWDLTRVPGGSSGGSAASVAADTAIVSLGTDTGGSIRQPAGFCSIVGMKPTYGRVSRYGVIAFASSLDQVGPMTKDVADCALMMNVIAGHDKKDSTSLVVSVPDYTKSLYQSITGIKVGIPKEYFVEGIQPEVKQALDSAIKKLAELGADIIEVSLPHTDYAASCYYIIAPAEASSNLARYDGVRFGLRKTGHDLSSMYENTKTAGFGMEVKRRILLGTYVLSAGYYDSYYLTAQKVRSLIRQDFSNVFKNVDILVTPTSPTVPFKLGEKTSDPLQMYLSDVCTIPVNLAGLPGMSLPCGFSPAGLPIGLQLIGKPLDEATLIQVAHAYEQATEWHQRKPKL